MGREVRRRGRRRAAAAKEKNKNWFMKLKMWQRVLLCTVGVLICTFSAAAIYVAAKWGKIQTQDIEAKDLIINEEVQEKNGEINLGKVIPISPSLVWIPVMEILERETARTVLL